MKKVTVIPIIFAYLFAVMGIMVHVHYCGTEIESWNVLAENNGCTDGGCGDESEKPDGCCKDEVIAAKISQDQNIAHAFKLKQMAEKHAAAIIPATTLFIVQDSRLTATRAAQPYRANAPPGLWQHIPLYTLHSSFTYYG